jgi:UDP-glucose 4-epimerase
MNVMVTGGAGFIGSHLVDALLQRGHTVSVLDDFSTGKEENLHVALHNGATIFRANVREAREVADAVSAFRPAVIFHLAAQINVRSSVTDAGLDAGTNIVGTINVLDAAREAGAAVINISTGGAIYGDTDIVPTPESVQALPAAPYGQSKFCAERYVGLYGRLHGVAAATARFANVYGPRQDPRGEAGVIAIYCGLLRDGKRPVVYGTGRQTRDYVYVGDVVAGLLALLDHPEARGEYNIGTGRESSVLDLVEALAPHADGDFSPEFADARSGEIERSCLDVTRAREALGWIAQVELAEGLEHTMAWASSRRAELDRPVSIGGDPQSAVLAPS